MSASLKRKRTDAELASGSAFSQISPNNWLDPQYINLQTLKNGLKRATFCFTLSLSTLANIKKKSVPVPAVWFDFIQFELHLPECTGLNALSSNDNIKTCYSPPTGKTKLNFPNIHDVTIRHNYCPAGWKSQHTSGTGSQSKFRYETKDRVYMTCLLTDGRDSLQDMVPTSTDENNLMTFDGLFDLTRYSMGDGLIEGCGETHVFGPDLTFTDIPIADVEKYHLTLMTRDTGRRTFHNTFSNITKGGYQVLNDNLKLLVHDSAIRWNMDKVGATDCDNNSFNSGFVPWTLSVQIDYDVRQIELDKLLVYRQSLQQYISAKVKPEQKLVDFLDAVDAAGIPIIESRFECNDKAKSVDQAKSKKKILSTRP